MAVTLEYTNTLKEAAADNGTVEGSVVIKVTGADFAGNVGESLTDATVTKVPAGLTAVLEKTSANTATLTLTGKADTHDADIADLTVTLAEESFASGAVLTGVDLVKSDLRIDFLPLAGGESEPPASHVPFSGPLFITSVKELATGAGGDPTIGAAGKVELTGYAATPNSTITIFNGSKKVGDSVKPDPVTGVWTFETPSLDKAGVYNFTAKETFIDNSGTKEKTLYGGPSNTLTYTVDTKAPPAPKVDKFKLPTANTTPTITGKAEKFAEVEVFAKLGAADPTSLGKVQANDKGIWSLQVENALAEGTYALTAEATDAAGNKNTVAGKAETLTIDTSVAAFSITADKGLKYSDDAKVWATKKFSSQKLEGKAEANSVIHFFGGPDGSVPLGKPVKVNKSGDWKATLKLTDGEHVISAVIIDQAGNISESQSLGTIKVDAFAPIATVKKEDKTPTKLSGLVEHDAVEVEVFAGKTSLGTVKTGLENGTWELDVTGKDIKGKQKITVTATDAAGNVSKPSAGVTYDFTEAAGDGGGAGAVTIEAKATADAQTLTDKAETFVTKFGSEAVAQVDTITLTGTWANKDEITVKGVATDDVTVMVATGDITVGDDAATAAAIAAKLVTEINTASGATVTAAIVDGKLTVVANDAGTAFEATVTDDGPAGTVAIETTTANAAAVNSFSNLAALDVLTSFTIGTDKVGLKTAAGAAADTPTALTRVNDVTTETNSNDLSGALSAAFAGLEANVAGLVVITAGNAAGTYLYADNGNDTVDTAADVFIKLVGTTGDLGAVGALKVGDFFA